MRTVLVAYVDFPEGVGGDTRRVHMLAKSLLGPGDEVILLIPCPRGLVAGNRNAVREETVEGIRVLRVSARGSYGHAAGQSSRAALSLLLLRVGALLGALYRLVRLRAERRIDVVFLYQPTCYDGLPLALLARLLGARTAADYSDLSFVDHEPIERNWARRIWSVNYRWGLTVVPRFLHRAYAISSYLEEYLRARLPGASIGRLPPVVDTSLFEVLPPPGFLAERLGVGPGPVVLYAGALFENEGVDFLLEAAPSILSAVPGARIVILGAHPKERFDLLAARARRDGLLDRVYFPGVVPSTEIPLFLAAAQVLVAPKTTSVLNRAGVPTKLAEYLASGVPAVVSSTGDIPLVAADGEGVLFVAPEDARDLAEKIVSLLADPARAREIGARGRAWAVARMDARVVGARLRRELIG